jgi:hypothetical protein
MAQYRDGTVTVTSNSATLTGADTKWVTAGIEPGHWFTVRGQGITYTVAAVLSETQIVLSGAYQGATQAGVFYLLHTDFTPRGYAVPGPNDVDATIIVRRAIYDIDADMTAALGSPDGAASAIKVSDILDLNSSTALTGQVMSKLTDGTYGFVTPASLSVTLVNLAAAAANVGQVYAGTSATTGAHQFRALQVTGASLSQNADRLTLTVPAPGEVNTLASIGTATATSLVAPKTGTTLNTYGLRGANGVTVALNGSDVVITGSGTGGGTASGEANTAENLGPAGTTVVRPFADKLGVSLRFRSMLFDPSQFTVVGETTGQYSIGVRRQRLADSPDVSLVGAVPGQIIRLENDNIWRAQALPPAGLPNLQADPNPRLGGNLAVSGRRIVGIADTLSGMIETPQSKLYTLLLRANAPLLISSMIATCASGTVLFELWNGLPAESLPGGTVTAPITSTATPAALAESISANGLLIDVGDRLTLRLVVQSASAEDFSFSIAYTSA